MSGGPSLPDLLRLVPCGGPAICNISVTNSCNATCSFCNFAHDKGVVTDRRWLDAERFAEALTRLRDRAGVRFVTFMGGEPLLHPNIAEMAATASGLGVQPTLVTNGWLLPAKLDALVAAGVTTLFISIDAADAGVHETNRGLKGVCDRIREATARMAAYGVTPIASVAMTRLIGDYGALAAFLKTLGFAAVTFSYPRKAALGSSSLVWSEDSGLVDLSPDELIAAFDAVDAVRPVIPVFNPSASVADMRRRLRGEAERFPCLAGYKYFYLDWNYDLWRCEDWREPLCSVWDFEASRMVRDGCQACMTDCYRDASVMLHFAVALGDAFARLCEGRLGAAAAALADRRNAVSLGAVIDHGSRLSRLAGFGTSR
ncbi:radical SAM protein [Azospirillum sp. sgz301742]